MRLNIDSSPSFLKVSASSMSCLERGLVFAGISVIEGRAFDLVVATVREVTPVVAVDWEWSLVC